MANPAQTVKRYRGRHVFDTLAARKFEGNIGSPYQGNTYYVDSSGSDGNNGRYASNPLKTINAAIGKCSAENDDYSMVMDSWQEGATIELDKAGIHIIAMGNPYHLGYAIPDEDRDNQDPAVQLEQTGAEWLSSQFQLNREILIAATVFSTSNWETYVTGVTNFTQWDDYDDSNPVTQINTAKQTIQKSTGFRPNVCVMGQEVLDVLVEHPLLLEKFKYTAAGILDAEEVRRALKIDKLLIGGAVYDDAAEDASANGRYIWGKNVWLGYVPAAAGIRVPAAGYTFELRQPSAGGQVASIQNTREDNRDRDFLKGKYAFDDKVIGADLGYYIASAVS